MKKIRMIDAVNRRNIMSRNNLTKGSMIAEKAKGGYKKMSVRTESRG
jgi:hypothetical protein